MAFPTKGRYGVGVEADAGIGQKQGRRCWWYWCRFGVDSWFGSEGFVVDGFALKKTMQKVF